MNVLIILPCRAELEDAKLDAMKAIVISRPGEAEVLQVRDVPRPRPRPGQVLVRVRATALNRADLLQRRGLYPAPEGIPQEIPGLEFSGQIELDLSGVDAWKTGQSVMGLLPGAGYAEFVAVSAEHLLPVPEHLGWNQAAAIPEAFLTAFDALCLQGELKASEVVLIQAVASGVGGAGLQIAREVGATVIGTSRHKQKLGLLEEFGLRHGIDSGREDVTEAVREITHGRGVDLILDLVGGDHFDSQFSALAPQGRIIVVGLVAGRRASLDLGLLLRKRVLIRGTVLRSRSNQEKADLISRFRQQVMPWIESQAIQPLVDRVFPFSQVVEAHRYMEENRNIGKIVLEV